MRSSRYVEAATARPRVQSIRLAGCSGRSNIHTNPYTAASVIETPAARDHRMVTVPIFPSSERRQRDSESYRDDTRVHPEVSEVLTRRVHRRISMQRRPGGSCARAEGTVSHRLARPLRLSRANVDEEKLDGRIDAEHLLQRRRCDFERLELQEISQNERDTVASRGQRKGRELVKKRMVLVADGHYLPQAAGLLHHQTGGGERARVILGGKSIEMVRSGDGIGNRT